jgi:flagellin-specific chaperone FliS
MYMGGSGYHKKFDTIKVVVAQYIYNLLLARDPNFKKKEYIQKANRILLKLETCVIMNERDRISEMIDSSYTMVDRGILSNKNLLGLKRHLKKLNDRIKLLPKLTDTEKEFITRSI